MGNLFAPCAVVCREDQNPHRLPCKLIPRLLERCKAGERADFAVWGVAALAVRKQFFGCALQQGQIPSAAQAH